MAVHYYYCEHCKIKGGRLEFKRDQHGYISKDPKIKRCGNCGYWMVAMTTKEINQQGGGHE